MDTEGRSSRDVAAGNDVRQSEQHASALISSGTDARNDICTRQQYGNAGRRNKYSSAV